MNLVTGLGYKLCFGLRNRLWNGRGKWFLALGLLLLLGTVGISRSPGFAPPWLSDRPDEALWYRIGLPEWLAVWCEGPIEKRQVTLPRLGAAGSPRDEASRNAALSHWEGRLLASRLSGKDFSPFAGQTLQHTSCSRSDTPSGEPVRLHTLQTSRAVVGYWQEVVYYQGVGGRVFYPVTTHYRPVAALTLHRTLSREHTSVSSYDRLRLEGLLPEGAQVLHREPFRYRNGEVVHWSLATEGRVSIVHPREMGREDLPFVTSPKHGLEIWERDWLDGEERELIFWTRREAQQQVAVFRDEGARLSPLFTLRAPVIQAKDLLDGPPPELVAGNGAPPDEENPWVIYQWKGQQWRPAGKLSDPEPLR